MKVPNIKEFEDWLLERLKRHNFCQYGGMCYPSIKQEICRKCFEEDKVR